MIASHHDDIAPGPFLQLLTWHSLYDLLLQNKETKQYNTILSSDLKATSDTYLKISSLLYDCIHPLTSLYPPSQSVMLFHLFCDYCFCSSNFFVLSNNVEQYARDICYNTYASCHLLVYIYQFSLCGATPFVLWLQLKILHTIWRKEMYAVSVHNFPLSYFSFSLFSSSFSPYLSHPPSLFFFAVMLSLSFCSRYTALFWLQIF